VQEKERSEGEEERKITETFQYEMSRVRERKREEVIGCGRENLPVFACVHM
jgi:hypothetical protein